MKNKNIWQAFKRLCAFNMLEVTISLITIACIASAFVPVITKKVTHSSLAIRQTTEAITDCTEISVDGVQLDGYCKICYPEKCMVCNKFCATDEAKRVKTCECKSCAERKCVNVNADGNEVTTDQTNVCKKDKVCIKCSDPDLSTTKNCDRCKGGYYLRTTDYMCKQCLPGHRCPEPTSPCPDPCKTFFGRNASSGTPSIQYSQWSDAGSTVCNLPCPAGYYCHTDTLSTKFDGNCNKKRIKEQCRYGHYCISGLEQEMCPMGKYQDERGKASCKNCPAETWHPNATQTSFDSVNDDDKYVFDHDENRYGLDEKYRYSSACTAALCGDNANCINGVRTRCSGKQFATKGENIKDDSGNNFPQHTCQNCTKGYCCTRGFRHKCNKGTYAASTMECILTEDNSPSSSKNGDRDKPADCTYCPPGKYQDTQTQSSCKNCAPGWWTCAADGVRHESGNYNQASKRTCLKKINGLTTDKTNGCGHKCEKGYYCPGDGTKRLCTKGHYCPEGSSKMTDCPCGYKCPEDGMWTPTACPCGQYQPNTTQTACLNVPCGHYQNETAKCNYKAVPCGHYQPNVGKCDYIQTPVGYYQDATGQCSPKIVPCGHYQDEKAKCNYKACPCGQYQNEQGKTSCKTVPCGNYQASVGQCGYNACPAGQYQNGTGKCSCIAVPCGNYQDKTGQCGYNACPLCKWQDATGQTGCKESGAGYYVPKTGQCARTACPAGNKCPNSCASAATCCPIGYKQPNTTQTTCVACPAGQYQPSTCQSACVDAPCGQYTDTTGQSATKSCPTGMYQNEKGKTGCKNCPGGQYQDATGQCSCKQCPAGKYCPEKTTTPITCPAGKYCPAGSAAPTNCTCGNYCPQGASAPTACGAGKYSAAGSSSCTNCPKGQYCPSATTCTPTACPCGTYSTGSAAACTNCGEGKYSAAGSSSCTTCPKGHKCHSATTCTPTECACGHVAAAGSSACSACPAGQYQDATGKSSCKDVPKGYYQNKTGKCDYKACPAGQYSTGGASGCTGCPAGTYAPNAASSSCTNCPAGQYCPGSTSSPSTCPCGYYCPKGSGGYADRPCGTGKYSAAGASSCTNCPTGMYCSSKTTCKSGGTTNVTKCACGTYSAGSVASCADCGKGKYSAAGASSCTDCPTGKYCSSKTTCTPQDCTSGNYSCASASSCSACTKWHSKCTKCSCSGCSKCDTGYKVDGTGCKVKFDCSDTNMFVKIGNLCIMKYNLGDGGFSVPGGITVVKFNEVCTRDDHRCCFTGTPGAEQTTAWECDDKKNPYSYSACGRTVCTINAAKYGCSHLNYGEVAWRMPTRSDLAGLVTTTKNSSGHYKVTGDSGLQVCSIHDCNWATCYNNSERQHCKVNNSNGSTAWKHCYTNDIWTVTDGAECQYGLWKTRPWEYYCSSGEGSESVRCVHDM